MSIKNKTCSNKKGRFFLSLSFIMTSTIYAFSQHPGNAQSLAANVSATSSGEPTMNVPLPKRVTNSILPSVKPRTGLYADGSYTGNPADAYYGNVEVRAIVQNGKLADVQFLQYPNDRRNSQYINGYAMPILKSEAIKVQSSKVDIVSGATDTSDAFQQSLHEALIQAQG